MREENSSLKLETYNSEKSYVYQQAKKYVLVCEGSIMRSIAKFYFRLCCKICLIKYQALTDSTLNVSKCLSYNRK